MARIFILLVAVFYFTWSATYLLAQDDHDHSSESVESAVEDNHEGHDHGEHEGHNHDDHADHNDHETHDHSDHDGHDHSDHEDELLIQLTPEGVKLAGIVVSKVTQKKITKSLELPGEIGFNEDRLVHVSPRFAGVALKANFRVGDFVNKGDIIAKIESNESMNSYSIKAPISGWVIDRHITTGEFVSEENSIYVIADLSTVWANLVVYPKDMQRVKKGQRVTIRSIGSDNITSGTIEFVTPIVDYQTRSATARIVLSNPDIVWRPGSFIQASISNENGIESLVVENDAVQYLDGESVVFVTDGARQYKPVEVIIGESDDKYIQILYGLIENSEYVSKGAFELKAKIVTSNLDAHAGHGH